MDEVIEVNKIDEIKKRSAVEIPSSKSYTNRALIIASLVDGKTILHNPLYSDDTKYMMESLEKIGVVFEKNNKDLVVYGNGGNFALENDNVELFCGMAGTTSRFLTGLLALMDTNVVINGEGKILERPIGELVEGLRQIGVKIDYLGKTGSLPLRGNGKSIGFAGNHNEISMNGGVSSQYFTALMMVAPLLKNGLTINVIDKQVSSSYIDMTIDIMKTFGVDVVNKNYKQYVIEPAKYRAVEYSVEGDWSSASYFCCLGALFDGGIEVANVNNNSVQGDKNFVELLKQMGAEVKYCTDSVFVRGRNLKPIDVDMKLMPDAAVSLAVLLSFVDGKSKITGLSTLKNKESDRLMALHNELKKLSIDTEIGDDFIIIYGGKPKVVGEIETYNDHRIAMSFAIAGAKLGGLKIKNPAVVSKSFPDFWNCLNKFR